VDDAPAGETSSSTSITSVSVRPREAGHWLGSSFSLLRQRAIGRGPSHLPFHPLSEFMPQFLFVKTLPKRRKRRVRSPPLGAGIWSAGGAWEPGGVGERGWVAWPTGEGGVTLWSGVVGDEGEDCVGGVVGMVARY
jgi:hypothetical protein